MLRSLLFLTIATVAALAQAQAPIRIESWESLEKTINADSQKILDSMGPTDQNIAEALAQVFLRSLDFGLEKKIYESHDAYLWRNMALQGKYWNVSYFGLSCLAKTKQPEFGLTVLGVWLASDTAFVQPSYLGSLLKEYKWPDSDLPKAAAIVYSCSDPERLDECMQRLPKPFLKRLLNEMQSSRWDSAMSEAVLLSLILGDADPEKNELPGLRALALKLKQLPGLPRWGFLTSFGKLGIDIDRGEWLDLLSNALSDQNAQKLVFWLRLIARNRDFIIENQPAIEAKLDEEHIKRLKTVLGLTSKWDEWQNPIGSHRAPGK